MKDEPDDLTLVYMFGYKNGKDRMKAENERLRAALQEIEQLSRRKAEGSPNRKIIHQIAFHVITGEKTDD